MHLVSLILSDTTSRFERYLWIYGVSTLVADQFEKRLKCALERQEGVCNLRSVRRHACRAFGHHNHNRLMRIARKSSGRGDGVGAGGSVGVLGRVLESRRVGAAWRRIARAIAEVDRREDVGLV